MPLPMPSKFLFGMMATEDAAMLCTTESSTMLLRIAVLDSRRLFSSSCSSGNRRAQNECEIQQLFIADLRMETVILLDGTRSRFGRGDGAAIASPRFFSRNQGDCKHLDVGVVGQRNAAHGFRIVQSEGVAIQQESPAIFSAAAAIAVSHGHSG